MLWQLISIKIQKLYICIIIDLEEDCIENLKEKYCLLKK